MIHDSSDPLRGETDLSRPLSPPHHQLPDGTVRLGTAGRQHRHLPGRRRVRQPLFLAPCLELLTPLRERHDLSTGKALDVCHPLDNALPADSQASGESAA